MITRTIDPGRAYPNYSTGTRQPVMLFGDDEHDDLGNAFLSQDTIIWLVAMRKKVAESKALRLGSRKQSEANHAE